MTFPEDLGTIASIWAHPDDETYLAGGVMAAAAARGQRVVCVSATAGELGTSDPEGWPPERLGRVRRWEAAAAMAILGVADHRWLGYVDGSLAGLPPDEPVDRIAAILAEVRPDTTLTFGSDGYTFHSDHRTVCQWVSLAWHRAGRPGRLLHAAMSDEHLSTWGGRYTDWGVFMTDERPTGVPDDRLALDVRLTGVALDQKVAALNAMHTQTAAFVALVGEDDFRALNEQEAFVEAP